MKEFTAIYKGEKLQSLLSLQVENGVKVFNYCLQLQNSQQKDEITFMLKDLVEKGLYKNEETAYRGIKNIFTKLIKTNISVTHTRGNKEIGYEEGSMVLYYKISYNEPCKVGLLPKDFIDFKEWLPTLRGSKN